MEIFHLPLQTPTMSFSYGNTWPAAYDSKIEGNVIIFKLDACEKLTLAEIAISPWVSAVWPATATRQGGLDKD